MVLIVAAYFWQNRIEPEEREQLRMRCFSGKPWVGEEAQAEDFLDLGATLNSSCRYSKVRSDRGMFFCY